jgi:hypothetical protein
MEISSMGVLSHEEFNYQNDNFDTLSRQGTLVYLSSAVGKNSSSLMEPGLVHSMGTVVLVHSTIKHGKNLALQMI